MNPSYPVYIISKGRWESRYTIRSLEYMGVPYHVVVEPQERDRYASVIDPQKIMVTPFSNLGQGSIPVRNFIWEHAISLGAKRHWCIDDNIMGFYRLNRNNKLYVESGAMFKAAEDFVDRYENVAIAGFQYWMFAPKKVKLPPFFLNTRIYSCVAFETLILCADLVWRAAGSLPLGQRVVAFDEEPSSGDGRSVRQYRTATIERNEPAEKSCYRVETDTGPPITASDEHPWLVWRRPARKRQWMGRPIGEQGSTQGRLCWVETRDLRVGDKIAHLARPWVHDKTHDGGWISGMFDGEGSMGIRTAEGRSVSRSSASARTTGVGIGIAQKAGPVLDRLRSALTERGYSIWQGFSLRSHGTHLRGGFPEMLRFAGEFRPTRILNRVEKMWEGRKLWQGGEKSYDRKLWRGGTYSLATVTLIKPVGRRQVASITTSTGTFITGGYLTHNCILIQNDIPYRWRGRYNEDTDLSLRALKDGWCTVLFYAFIADKMTTMTLSGGNTDELYAGTNQGPKEQDGRWKMAESLRLQHPDVTRITWKFGRWQHQVNYEPFKRNRLRLKSDAIIQDGVNNYGMTLQYDAKNETSPDLQQK